MIPAPDLNPSALAPIGFAAIGAMAVLMGEVLLSRREAFLGQPVTEMRVSTVLMWTAIGFFALALLASAQAFLVGSSEVFDVGRPTLRLDRFSSFAIGLVCVASILACWLSHTYLVEIRASHGEYYALLLLAGSGMMLMVAAIDMLTVFLGLELMSIPIYVLAGFDRRNLRSNESALKYFLVGSFASALLLYGMALLYGATGHTSFEGIRGAFDASNGLALAGLGLVVVGFAFKISSVPFHQWTPDVYEGAPSSVTAYMSVTVKAAAFVTLLRILVVAFQPQAGELSDLLWGLAALTMIVGNVMAVIQDNVKRLLAYSSVAHAGYLLLGIVAGSQEGYSAVLFYLVCYVFVNLGAFAVIVSLANQARDCERIEELAGLAKTRPALAALMTLFMVALAGIPGTAGFTAKLFLFIAAVKAGYVWLTVIAVLASAVSVYYYLRIPVVMWMREPSEEGHRLRIDTGEGLVLGICGFFAIYLGLFPNQGWLPVLGEIHVLDWARLAVAFLF